MKERPHSPAVVPRAVELFHQGLSYKEISGVILSEFPKEFDFVANPRSMVAGLLNRARRRGLLLTKPNNQFAAKKKSRPTGVPSLAKLPIPKS